MMIINSAQFVKTYDGFHAFVAQIYKTVKRI